MPESTGGPLLFLDVDGPLIPFGASRDVLPDGYPTFGHHSDNPLVARLNPALGPRLMALPCELVWATTWESEANEVLAPLLGVDKLRVVLWPETAGEAVVNGVHWKTSTLVTWADGRPFAWLDDEITESDRAWVEARHSGPSLLRRVDHRVGLNDADFAAVLDWLQTV